MREVHIYRGHEHYVVKQGNKIKNVEINNNKKEVKEEMKEEVKEEKKRGKRNEKGNSNLNGWK